MMPRVSVRLPARPQKYEIKIGAGLLTTAGRAARGCLGSGARRVALISNQTVFEHYGERVVKSLRTADFTVACWLMKDGERHKSQRSLEQALAFFSDSGLERNDAVIAVGGGVVGDLAGFAAAVYLRGIAFVQVPTTLLAQIDASVGGKTGVNTAAGKNTVGAFHQPKLVLIDTDTLQTLPQRELTSGWCEAVKQGLAGSRKLFDQTHSFLRSKSAAPKRLQDLIAEHCSFKASIVSRDELEEVKRTDRFSRRILNFGHTTAHALEKVTDYRRFRHGEAVGYGMLVAGEISKGLGMLGSGELELLREAVRSCGPLPRANDLSLADLTRAIARDKKSVGGAMKWVLLERIGRARIVDGNEIAPQILLSALRAGLRTT